MAYTLQDTINFCQAFIQYSPLTAGTGSEPAVSIASMVRDTILNAPFTWSWNRNEYDALILEAETQDYMVPLTDFAYLEKVTLINQDGSYAYELKDVYNTNILGVSVDKPAQPKSVAVRYYTPGESISLRFLSVPDQNYTSVLTYQKLPVPFSPYFATYAFGPAGQTFPLTEVVVTGPTATYTGSITGGAANAYAGMTFPITGFMNPGNNVSFAVTSSTATTLVGTVATQVNEVNANADQSWDPIPESFKDIYNNLFLAEAFQAVDDDQQASRYRIRGVAALLSKAEGLTEMQRNAFLAQYLVRESQSQAAQLRTQQAIQGRGV